MATVFSDVDSPLGSPINIRGTRRYVIANNPTLPAAEITGMGAQEDLVDLVFNGVAPDFIDNRTREDLVALLSDLADYCATLHRENRVVVFRRHDNKPVQFGNPEVDTRMQQDVACVQHPATGGAKTSNIEKRLKAIEEKLGL
jgi:hypothetical protein